jgi:hypothetical protein
MFSFQAIGAPRDNTLTTIAGSNEPSTTFDIVAFDSCPWAKAKRVPDRADLGAHMALRDRMGGSIAPVLRRDGLEPFAIRTAPAPSLQEDHGGKEPGKCLR